MSVNWDKSARSLEGDQVAQGLSADYRLVPRPRLGTGTEWRANVTPSFFYPSGSQILVRRKSNSRAIRQEARVLRLAVQQAVAKWADQHAFQPSLKSPRPFGP